MKRWLFLVATAALLLTAEAHAGELYVKGYPVITGSANGVFYVNVQSSGQGGCPSDWFYAFKADFESEASWQALQANVLTAFSLRKLVDLYTAGTANCSASQKRFDQIWVYE